MLILAFAAAALLRARQIAGQDEILHSMRLGRTLLRQGFSKPEDLIVFSPHLYGFAVWLSYTVFGVGVTAARLPGILAWVGAGAMFGWYTHRGNNASGPDRVVSLPPLLLLLTMPLALQAGAIVDIDNTILVPAVLLLCLAVGGFVEHGGSGRGAGVACVMGLALWCRLTTPTILVPVFLVYAAVRAGRARALKLGACLLLGWSLFSASWWGYCLVTGVDVAGPFNYLARSFAFTVAGPDRGMTPSKVALSVVYTVLWIGPGVVALWGLTGMTRAAKAWRRRSVESQDLFLLAGSAIVIGYCVVGGTLFGFPKYHCPGIPLLLLAASMTFGGGLLPADRKQAGLAAGLLLAGICLQVALLRDPLLVLRVDLRRALLVDGGQAKEILGRLALRLAVAGIVGGGLLALACRRRISFLPAALSAAAIGMNLGMAGIQALGGYQTGYNYGDRGDARRLAGWLERRLPAGKTAIVPGEIVYLLEREDVRHVPNELWSDDHALAKALASPATAAVAASLLTNTAAQMRTLIAGRATQSVLGNEYERIDLGQYVLYARPGILSSRACTSPPMPGPAPPRVSSVSSVSSVPSVSPAPDRFRAETKSPEAM